MTTIINFYHSRWRDFRARETSRLYIFTITSRTTETQCDPSVYVSEPGVATQFGTHNHPDDPTLKEDCLFKQQVKNLAQNVLREPHEVLREACRQFVDKFL